MRKPNLGFWFSFKFQLLRKPLDFLASITWVFSVAPSTATLWLPKGHTVNTGEKFLMASLPIPAYFHSVCTLCPVKTGKWHLWPWFQAAFNSKVSNYRHHFTLQGLHYVCSECSSTHPPPGTPQSATSTLHVVLKLPHNRMHWHKASAISLKQPHKPAPG